MPWFVSTRTLAAGCVDNVVVRVDTNPGRCNRSLIVVMQSSTQKRKSPESFGKKSRQLLSFQFYLLTIIYPLSSIISVAIVLRFKRPVLRNT